MVNKASKGVQRDAATADLGARSNSTEEAELKFVVPADAIDRVREAPALVRHARDEGTLSHLESVYYDTPDRALFSRGLSLRVRRNGQQFVQTVKRNPTHGVPFVRGEWEAPVSDMVPDLSSFPKGETSAPVDDLAASTLAPIFATKVRRRTLLLDFSGATVEAAFDDGVIEAGGRSEPLTEVELETKAGNPLGLYDLGLELLESSGPLSIATRSKSDRGYDLAYGLTPQPTKANLPDINANHSVDDVIGILLGSCQFHLLANQAVAEQGRDPEGVHQMRVALRRMRTIAKLFRKRLDLSSLEGLNSEAKWLGKVLGAARDWDVFVTDTLRAPSEELGQDVDFDGLRRAAEPHRSAAYGALYEAFATPRYNRFQLSLQRWLQARSWRNELRTRPLAALLEPAAAFAGRTLMQLHRKILKNGKHFQQLQPEDRHQLRIALKKLRYATDFFQASHGVNDEAKPFLACIAGLQETLGHENDVSVTTQLISLLEQEQLDRGIHRAIGVVTGWHARGRLNQAKAFRRQWHRFKAITPFWASWPT